MGSGCSQGRLGDPREDGGVPRWAMGVPHKSLGVHEGAWGAPKGVSGYPKGELGVSPRGFPGVPKGLRRLVGLSHPPRVASRSAGEQEDVGRGTEDILGL